MKVALGLLIAAQLIAMPAATVDANAYTKSEDVIEYSVESEEPTRHEEFQWFYRMHNGVPQKRLWSITYMYWVTDWIDC